MSETARPVIRPAAPADNPALLALNRKSPMRSGFEIRIDRSPDYFYLSRLQGRDSRVIVAEHHSRLLGCVGYALRDVFIAGRLTTIAYIGGIKVAPEYRGSRITFRLMQAARDALLKQPVDMGFMLVLHDNHSMLNLLSGRAGIPRFSPLADFQLSYIIPLYKPRLNGLFNIEQAIPADRDELFDFLGRAFAGYELRPVWTPAVFDALLRADPHFSLSRFWIARRQSRIMAVVSLWDQSHFKQTSVVQYPIGLRLLRRLTLGRLLPPPGQPIHELCIRHAFYAPGGEVALRELLRFVIAHHYPQYRYFRIGFPTGSAIRRMLAGLPQLRTVIRAFVAFHPDRSIDEGLIRRLVQSPLWEDLSLH